MVAELRTSCSPHDFWNVWRKMEHVPVWVLDGEYGQAMVRWCESSWDAILRIPALYERQTWAVKVDLPIDGKVYWSSLVLAKERAEQGLREYERLRDERALSVEYVYPVTGESNSYWTAQHVANNLGVWR